MAQVAHDCVRRPLAGQEGRGRRAQDGEEVEEIAEPLRAGELLGPNHAKQQDEARCRAQGDDRKQVPGASRREHVDQDKRHRAAHDGRQDQHRHDRHHGVGQEQDATAVDDSIRREDRDRHQGDHPRRVQQRLAQLREVKTQPIDRGGHEQIEVLGEEEARQRGDHVRQNQDRDEGEQHQPEDLGGEKRPELLGAADVLQDQVQHSVHADPEQQPHGDEEQ